MPQTDRDSASTRVIFRYWRTAPHRGDIDAILLDVPATPGRVMVYCHVGQHGEGDYGAVIQHSRPATPEEYALLKRELEGIGYVLEVCERRTRGGLERVGKVETDRERYPVLSAAGVLK